MYDTIWKKLCSEATYEGDKCTLYSYYSDKKNRKFKIEWTASIENMSLFVTELCNKQLYRDFKFLATSPLLTRQKRLSDIETCEKDILRGFEYALDANAFVYFLAKFFFVHRTL